ncbi:MAG: hypothetical protein JWO22_2294 [Frankiales bacterium]|nr:hypothetical protein [Frankiales bacterium]
MPDISDLLKAGAGDPLAPPDLDRAVRRGAQRTRNRLVAQAAVGSSVVVVAAVAGLSLAGGGTSKAQVGPGSGLGQTRLLPDDSLPTSGPSADPRLQPVAAADPSQLPDGFNFVLVRSVQPDGSLVVDKVTRTTDVTAQGKCAQAQDGSYSPADVFSFCWSNQNAKLRTVPLASGVTTVPFQPDGGPREDLSRDDLGRLLTSGNDLLKTEVYVVAVSHNTVESIALAGNV